MVIRALRGASALGLGALVATSAPARAESPRASTQRVSLVYDANPGCLDADGFKSLVVSRLGYDPFVASAPDKVLVQLRAGASRRGARIAWMDESGGKTGEQTFAEGPSKECLSLARAVGFALAVQIDLFARVKRGDASASTLGIAVAPTGSQAAASPAPEPAPSSEPEPAKDDDTSLAGSSPPEPVASSPPPEVLPVPIELAPAPTVTASAEAPRSSSGPRLAALGGGAGYALGISSQGTVLARVFSSWSWRSVAGDLALEMSVPTVTRRADGAGYSQQDFFLSLGAGPDLAPWQLQILAKAGPAHLQGQDIDRTDSGWIFAALTGLRVGVSIPAGPRVRLIPHVDGLIALSRWTARLDHLPVWTSPRFSATFGLDLSLQL